MNKSSSNDAFVKVIKVVDSCTTVEQLKSAERYMLLFFNTFPFPDAAKMYECIERLHNTKRKELNVKVQREI